MHAYERRALFFGFGGAFFFLAGISGLISAGLGPMVSEWTGIPFSNDERLLSVAVAIVGLGLGIGGMTKARIILQSGNPGY